MKKRSDETARWHVVVRPSQKEFAPPQTHPPPLPGGAGRPKFSLLDMVTTLSYKPSWVRIDVRNFEL